MDGELDRSSSQSVEHHISQCGACRKLVDDFQEVDDLLRGLPKFDTSPDFVGQILEKVGESQAPAARKPSDRSPLASLMRFLSSFMDLLETRNSPSTHTLDEFGDFPPFSMGHIYFKLLDQPGRG